MSLSKMDAIFAYQEKDYYKVIEVLSNENKKDFEVIAMLGTSYFAIGELMKSYVIFEPLFDENQEIYKLPNNDRYACYPLGSAIFKFLQGFDIVQEMLSNTKKAGWNLYLNRQTEKDLILRDREAVERYINYAQKYLAGNDPYDYFAGLLFMEVAVTLVEPPMAKLYDLKCQLIERLFGSFVGSLEQEVNSLFRAGYNCVLKKYTLIASQKV